MIWFKSQKLVFSAQRADLDPNLGGMHLPQILFGFASANNMILVVLRCRSGRSVVVVRLAYYIVQIGLDSRCGRK